MSAAGIFNFVKIDDQIATAGQPSEAQFAAAAAEGYKTVINLAPYKPDNGTIAHEADILRGLGLGYRHIPVEWTAPQKSEFEQFCTEMDSLRGDKVLIHCVANMRVTAFFSLYAMKRLGWTENQADALMNPIWNERPEYKEGGIWREFIVARRREILAGG